MAAGERARARAERERQAAAEAAERAAAAERDARRRARRQTLTGWIPRPHPGQSGTLAARRRAQVSLTIAAIVALNLLVFFASGEWSLRALVLVVSLLAAPVLYTVLFRRD